MKNRVIIIGAGPAGLAAAIQLKRYQLDVLVFEKQGIGGLAGNANLVENLLGFPRGISGPDLVCRFRDQIDSQRITVISEAAKLLEYEKNNRLFHLTTVEHNKYFSDFLVVASGTRPRKIDLLESLPDLLKEAIFYEVFPLLKVKGKKILIVGAGDAAFDYALNLAKNNELVILARGDRIRALPLLDRRIQQTRRVVFIPNARIREVKAGQLKKLACRVEKNQKTEIIESDYIVGAIGREPQKEFYSTQMKKDENRLINQRVLFLAGDVRRGEFRQISIAAGDGIAAAMTIYKKLRGY